MIGSELGTSCKDVLIVLFDVGAVPNHLFSNWVDDKILLEDDSSILGDTGCVP